MLKNALDCFLDWKEKALPDVKVGPDETEDYWCWTSRYGKIHYAFRWYCQDGKDSTGKWFYKLPLVTPSDFRLDGKCACYSCDEYGRNRYSIYKETKQSKTFGSISTTSKSLLDEINWLRKSQHKLKEVEEIKIDVTADAFMIYTDGLDICWEYGLDCIEVHDE